MSKYASAHVNNKMWNWHTIKLVCFARRLAIAVSIIRLPTASSYI